MERKEIEVKKNADGERYTMCGYQHYLATSCNECAGQKLVEFVDGEKGTLTEKF